MHSQHHDRLGDREVEVRLGRGGLTNVLEDVQRQLESALENVPSLLVVDMSSVEDLSSTTVAALLWMKRRCSERDLDLRLRHTSPDCLSGLCRMGLLDLFTVDVADTRD